MKLSKSSSSNLYNNSSEEFIPVACHYDQYTLLTKNGELLQTIQINGNNSEKITKNLPNLRKVVRESIHDNVDCKKLAFWVHTIRRKENLDDDTEYNNFLSANIHDIWRRKNYLDDKFVNHLYITVVYRAPHTKFKGFSSWVNSLSTKTVSNFEEKYFASAISELNNIVDSILEGVREYGAQKLSIRIDNEDCYSDPMFLYRRIMQLNEEDCPVPISDISLALASHEYTVGTDTIEVVENNDKKFAALMSIKEYKEVESDALEQFLQIPVEMIATEIFYFADRDEVVSSFKNQDYILKVSRDSNLRGLKGLDVIMDDNRDEVRFCYQQISFMIIGDDLNNLNKQVKKASEALSEIGIVHVREDINLEKTFWAQLPANFSFLSRMRPTVLGNTAALASLHNVPIGNRYNIWGRAITLLSTKKGSPYFVNFHDQTNIGTTCIFGSKQTGKTTLLNFLISEADKYNPTSLYLTNNMDSALYIKARGGKWIQKNKNIINPLLCDDTSKNKKFVFKFFKIIAGHYFHPLSKDELSVLKTLSYSILKLPKDERILSYIIQNLYDSGTAELEELYKRLSIYLPEQPYYGIFEGENTINLSSGDLLAINLQSFNDDEIHASSREVENISQDSNHTEFHRNNILGSVRMGIILAAQNLMTNLDDEPKLFVVDNLSEIMNLKHYRRLFPVLAKNMTEVNGVFLSTVNLDTLSKLHTERVSNKWINSINTSFILPSEILPKSIDEILDLDQLELEKLSKENIKSRSFLIRQDGKTIVSGLNIKDLEGLIRILSSGEEERELYQKIVEKFGEQNPEDWLQAVYEGLENII